MSVIADLVDEVIMNPEDEKVASQVKQKVNELMSHRPLFSAKNAAIMEE